MAEREEMRGREGMGGRDDMGGTGWKEDGRKIEGGAWTDRAGWSRMRLGGRSWTETEEMRRIKRWQEFEIRETEVAREREDQRREELEKSNERRRAEAGGAGCKEKEREERRNTEAEREERQKP